MSDLSFDYQKVSSIDEAFESIKSFVTPENIAKFKVKAEIEYDRPGKKMVATGTGFSLTVTFTDSKVDVDLKLSFILRPLRSKVLSTIEEEFLQLV
jgi:hypothetical protein